MTPLARPVKTLSPIDFGLHDARGSLNLLVSKVPGLPPVVPRLSVLRTRRTPNDALPQFVQLMASHMPLPLQPDESRLALAQGKFHVWVVPERQGGVLLAVMPEPILDFVRTLSHNLVWLSLAQDSKGTIAVGFAADGVTKVEIEISTQQKQAAMGRNAFFYRGAGLQAKAITALVVTSGGKTFRMPLNRKEFRR